MDEPTLRSSRKSVLSSTLSRDRGKRTRQPAQQGAHAARQFPLAGQSRPQSQADT